MKWAGPRLGRIYWRGRRDFNLWSLLSLGVVLLIALPLLSLLSQLWQGPGSSWGHLTEHLLPRYLGNSLALLLGTGALSLLWGVSTAWWVSRYEFPGRRSLEWLLILPLSIPSYIMAYAYHGFFDYGGPMGQWLGQPTWRLDMMHLPGLIWVLSLALFPYVYVSARAFFLHQSFSLLEASRSLGYTERRSFFKLLLPLSRPALVAGLFLVFMEVLNDYGAARYYGVQTFTTGIFRAWYALEEPQTAIYLSALLLALVFAIMAAERWWRRRRRYHLSASAPKRGGRRLRPRGAYRYGLSFVVAIPVLLGFALPLFQLLWWARLRPDRLWSEDFWSLGGQSFGLAALSASLLVILALALLLGTRYSRLAWVHSASRLAVLGYAIPGAIIAIGVMVPSLALDRWLGAWWGRSDFIWHGSIGILIYAYLVRFLAVSYQPLEASLSKIGRQLSDSSQILGASPWRTFRKIEFPLLRSALASAFVLVFIDLLKELPLSLILKPHNVSTLAVKAYEHASNEMLSLAAWPALAIVISAVPPVILLNRLILKDD